MNIPFSPTYIITISIEFLFGVRGSGHFKCVGTTLEWTFLQGQGISNYPPLWIHLSGTGCMKSFFQPEVYISEISFTSSGCRFARQDIKSWSGTRQRWNHWKKAFMHPIPKRWIPKEARYCRLWSLVVFYVELLLGKVSLGTLTWVL